jgi:phosphoglycolate phosphatase-like HAD superfamily hydrolase
MLIGDSINDYEAAIKNNIAFYGYKNQKLIDTFNYI